MLQQEKPFSGRTGFWTIILDESTDGKRKTNKLQQHQEKNAKRLYDKNSYFDKSRVRANPHEMNDQTTVVLLDGVHSICYLLRKG